MRTARWLVTLLRIACKEAAEVPATRAGAVTVRMTVVNAVVELALPGAILIDEIEFACIDIQ